MEDEENLAHRIIPQNVVCNAYLGNTVDLQHVCEILHGRYDPSVFPAVVSLVREAGDVSVSIFHSGQLVISGARSCPQAAHAAYLVAEKLNTDMWRTDLRVFNFAIQNIVGSSDLAFPLNLPVMNVYDKVNLNHNAEDFEGLHWRTLDPNIGYMVFGSGKVVATGMKNFYQIAIAEERLQQLNKYQLNHERVPESVIEAARRNIRFDKKRPSHLMISSSTILKRRRKAAERMYVETKKERRRMEYTQAERSVAFGSITSKLRRLTLH
jgi:transcription initiation factor TFIID TATA-box-binding protein